MALATLINGLVVFGLPSFGNSVETPAVYLWLLDACMAVACGVAIPYLMFTRQEHSTEGMTAVWLLPIVAGEVAASSAAILADHFPTSAFAETMVLIGYALWGFSVPMAFCIISILVMRLSLHKLPPIEMAPSMFLTLGPIGTGALGVLVLGSAATKVPPLAEHGQGLYTMGLAAGLVLWGVGFWWIAVSTLATFKYAKRGLRFNLGWWGYVFPLGVYSIATLRLAEATGRPEFWWSGLALITILTMLWAYIFCRTVSGAYSGRLFVAPCLTQR